MPGGAFHPVCGSRWQRYFTVSVLMNWHILTISVWAISGLAISALPITGRASDDAIAWRST